MGIENYSIVECPCCQNEIVVTWNKPSVLTVEAFQKEAKRLVKMG